MNNPFLDTYYLVTIDNIRFDKYYIIVWMMNPSFSNFINLSTYTSIATDK